MSLPIQTLLSLLQVPLDSVVQGDSPFLPSTFSLSNILTGNTYTYWSGDWDIGHYPVYYAM